MPFLYCLAAAACAPAAGPSVSSSAPSAAPPKAAEAAPVFPGEEKFLANVRQLTFGGQNAEAYW